MDNPDFWASDWGRGQRVRRANWPGFRRLFYVQGQDFLEDVVLEPWILDSICAGTDPEMFFPGRGMPADDARRICRRCPVMQECLDYAIPRPELDGVWGGESVRSRRRIRKMLGIPEDAEAEEANRMIESA